MTNTKIAVGVACLGLMLSGALAVSGAWQRRTVSSVQLGPLALQLEHVGWLHTEGHDTSMPMPGMSDLPREGEHRLSVELALLNLGDTAVTFEPSELGLYLGSGERRDSTREEPPVVLPPGQRFMTEVELSVNTTPEELQLVWSRGPSAVRLMTLRTPPDEARNAIAPAVWPAKANELPPPRPESGEELFTRTLGCASCHGPRDDPSGATVGPPLAHLAGRIAQRAPGTEAAQYVYDSVLDPDAVVVPECPLGRPCASPSVMPAYGERLSAQQMADLIAYLLSPVVASQE